MKSRLKILSAIVFLGFALILPSATVQAAGACGGFGDAFVIHSASGTPNAVGALPAFCTAASVATFAINLLLGLSGAVAVVFLMLGGFWYLTAAGNEEMAEKGRKMLTNSVIGLVIVIMSFAVVRIAINLLTTSTGGGSGTPPATTSANPPAGTIPPATTNPPANTSGNPVSTNPNNILSDLSQQDYANYDNRDHLSDTVTFTSQGTGFNAVSTVQSSDKQTLGQINAACGAATPPELQLFVGGRFNSGAPYTKGSSGNWTALLNYPGPTDPAQQYQIWICGHQIAAKYTPTR